MEAFSNNQEMIWAKSLAGQRWGLTMRAADGGWAARFSAFFVALSFFRFDSESTLLPTAVNASRWITNEEEYIYCNPAT